MHHVIEIVKVALVRPEGEIAQARIEVAAIVKQHPSNILADQREAQLGLVEQQRRSQR